MRLLVHAESSLNQSLRMNDDDDFIRDEGTRRAEARLYTAAGPLTGWENVVFELADEDENSE